MRLGHHTRAPGFEEGNGELRSGEGAHAVEAEELQSRFRKRTHSCLAARAHVAEPAADVGRDFAGERDPRRLQGEIADALAAALVAAGRGREAEVLRLVAVSQGDRKSTRLNSSHPSISYAVFCLK